MYFPKIILFLFLFASAKSFSMPSVPITNKKLEKVSNAIFDTFLPFSTEEMDSSLRHLVKRTKKNFVETINTTYPDLRAALFLLDNLHFLSNEIFIKVYYRFFANDKSEVNKVTDRALMPFRAFLAQHSSKLNPSIIELSIADRRQLFSALIQSDVSLHRLIGFYVRTLYTQMIYEGPLGEKISGIEDKGFIEAPILPDLPAFKTHLRYSKKSHSIKGTIDALIIGSGAAGSVVAHEFQNKGLKVMVVEAGPMAIPGAIDTTSNMRFMESQSPRLVADGSVALLNGETVGGGTAVNLDMSFPPTLDYIQHQFENWHSLGLIAPEIWTPEQLKRAYKWVESIYQPRLVEEEEININNAILREGAERLGIPTKRYELNAYRPDESPFVVYRKKSSFEQLLLPAMLSRNPLTLLSDCKVQEILFKHNRAVGIKCLYEPKVSGLGIVHDAYNFGIKPGTIIEIKAKNIILAAGNLGTTGILLKSKVANPNIGRGFVVHPFVSFNGLFDYEIRADHGEPSSIFIDAFMPTKDRPGPGYLIEAGLGKLSLWALLHPGSPEQVRNHFANIEKVAGFSVMVIDTPNEQNFVELNRNGTLNVHYHFSKKDKARLIDGMKKSVNIMFAGGAQEVSFNSFEYPLFQAQGIESTTLKPSMNIDEIFKHFTLEKNKTALLGSHMMAGNKMGTNPGNSVVDSDYKVWNYDNLFVVDGSVFRASPGANPATCISTIAKIFADNFLRDHAPLKQTTIRIPAH